MKGTRYLWRVNKKEDELTGHGSLLSNMPPSLKTPSLIQATEKIA